MRNKTVLSSECRFCPPLFDVLTERSISRIEARFIIQLARRGVNTMSFQAYLDNVEEKTGKTPNDFIAEAKEKNLTEFKDIIAWLKKDYGLGLGHARAVAYVIRNGPNFDVKQTTGPHRDTSGTLKLDGSGRKTGTRKRTGKSKGK
jgi:uncharacterized protein DUF4287